MATNNILLDGGDSRFSHIDVHRGCDHGAWVIILVPTNLSIIIHKKYTEIRFKR